MLVHCYIFYGFINNCLPDCSGSMLFTRLGARGDGEELPGGGEREGARRVSTPGGKGLWGIICTLKSVCVEMVAIRT